MNDLEIEKTERKREGGKKVNKERREQFIEKRREESGPSIFFSVLNATGHSR